MINKAMLIGNLGDDPKISATQNGGLVANISLATSEYYTDQQGQKQQKTEWHRVVLFGKQAEIAEQYLQKGSQVCIIGRIQTREWQDREGNRRFTTEIVAREMKMLSRRYLADTGGTEQKTSEQAGLTWPTDPTPDEIPF